MGCVLVLCLPFDVKKSRWVRLLSGPPEAAEAHQDAVAGADDVREDPEEGLQTPTPASEASATSAAVFGAS